MTTIRSLADLGAALYDPDTMLPMAPPVAPSPSMVRDNKRRAAQQAQRAARSAPMDGCDCRVCQWCRFNAGAPLPPLSKNEYHRLMNR